MWTIFRDYWICYNIAPFFFFFNVLVLWSWGMWDPRTPVRDWICILALEGKVPTTGPLGKFRPLILISSWLSGSSTDSNHLADFPLTVPFVPHSLSLHHTFLCSIIYFGTHHIWGARCSRGFPSGSDGKESSCNVETWVQSLSQADPLEEGMVTQLSILAWRIPMTEGHKQSDMTEQWSTHSTGAPCAYDLLSQQKCKNHWKKWP